MQGCHLDEKSYSSNSVSSSYFAFRLFVFCTRQTYERCKFE